MIDHWLPALRPQIEALCAAWNVPLGLPVAWIDVESGGRLAEVTSLGERGYFQLLPDESKDLGIDHVRLSTDQAYSLASGFKLIDYYTRVIRRICQLYGITAVREGSEYFYRLVKLGHAMGAGSAKVILADAQVHNSTVSWDMFKSYALQHDAEYIARLKHAPSKWFPFIDRMFALGDPYGVELAPAVA